MVVGAGGLSMLFLGLDLQGWVTVIAGILLALITLFTGYDHVDIPGFSSIRLNQQIGVSVLAASLATLFGDAQLASRRRLRDQRVRAREAIAAAEERIRADEERDRAAEARERAAIRAQRQDRCALAQLEFQLNPGPATRGRLADLIALLQEYGDLS
jgi:hypothetical protein